MFPFLIGVIADTFILSANPVPKYRRPYTPMPHHHQITAAPSLNPN